jgi:hypothetical protein
MRPFRRPAAVAVATALASAGLLVATAAPAWAPTCGASCGMYPKPPNPPATAEQCKHGGWHDYTDARGFAFANQGACVSYVASVGHSDHVPAPSAQFPTNPG